MAKKLILYLVSHASGELVEMLARNAIAQLDSVPVKRRMWKMIRHLGQIPEILSTIAEAPGFVLHSISHRDMREALESGCQRLNVPCHFALEPLIDKLAAHCSARVNKHDSSGNLFDEDYYRRIEAMKYALAHDDGLSTDDLDGADVIIVGVSRATKTPTCMYLASRGIKAANVPLVPGVRLPDALLAAQGPLIVGLTVDPARLAMIRMERLNALSSEVSIDNTDYIDSQALRKEVQEARRLFLLRGWPVIDASHRSIEQTAAMIIDLLKARAG